MDSDIIDSRVFNVIFEKGYITEEELNRLNYNEEKINRAIDKRYLHRGKDGTFTYDIGSAIILYNIAQAYRSAGQHEKAMKYLETAHQISPQNAVIKRKLFIDHFIRKDVDAAYEYFDELFIRKEKLSKSENFILLLLMNFYPKEDYREHVYVLNSEDMLPFMDGDIDIQTRILDNLYERNYHNAHKLFSRLASNSPYRDTEYMIKILLSSLDAQNKKEWGRVFEDIKNDNMDGALKYFEDILKTQQLSKYEEKIYLLIKIYIELSSIGPEDYDTLDMFLKRINYENIYREYKMVIGSIESASSSPSKQCKIQLLQRIVNLHDRLKGITPKNLDSKRRRLKVIDNLIDDNLEELTDTGIIFLPSRNREFYLNIRSRMIERGLGTALLVLDFDKPYVMLRYIGNPNKSDEMASLKEKSMEAYHNRDSIGIIKTLREYFDAGYLPTAKLLTHLGLAYLSLNDLKSAKSYLMFATSINNRTNRRQVFDHTGVIDFIEKMLQRFNIDEQYDDTDEYYGIKRAKEVVDEVMINGLTIVSALRKYNIQHDQTSVIKLVLAKKYAELGNTVLRDYYLELVSYAYPRSHFVDYLYEKTKEELIDISPTIPYVNKPTSKEE